MHGFLAPVIVTDRLADIRTFYETYFRLTVVESGAGRLLVIFTDEMGVEYLDAAQADGPITTGLTLLMKVPFAELEHERLTTAGIACSAITVEEWQAPFAGNTALFTFHDPSGTRIRAFQPFFGEKRQFTTTADRVEVRKLAGQS